MLIARAVEYGFVIELRSTIILSKRMNLAHMAAPPLASLSLPHSTLIHTCHVTDSLVAAPVHALCARELVASTRAGGVPQKRAGVNHRPVQLPVRGIYKETTAAGPFARSHRTGGKNSRQVTRDLPAPCFRALQAEGVCALCRPEGLCPDLTFS